eukprot:NODE_326_length_9650_cov_0.368129.p2 type:complete len:156 gc:universal NODE_326_length_9650_cov_0.368129:4458-4925(+)
MNGNKTIAFCGDEVHGSSESKNRITIVSIINAAGKKLSLIFIGKSIIPNDMNANKNHWKWLDPDVATKVSQLRNNGKFQLQEFTQFNIFCSNSNKGWINSIEQVCYFMDSHADVLNGSILLMDNYGAHFMSDEVLSRFSKVKHFFLHQTLLHIFL